MKENIDIYPSIELIDRAKNGDCIAQFSLARYYCSNISLLQDKKESFKWYRASAEQGYSKSQFALGKCYWNGYGVEKNIEKAIFWYKKSAKQGYYKAQFNLAICYINGYGVQKNYEAGAKLYLEVAKQGYACGQFNIGVCYAKGIGVQQNKDKAVHWYTLAAKQGHDKAQIALNVDFHIAPYFSFAEQKFTYKKDADEIKKFFEENNIRYLYHFTDVRNVLFIKNLKGLYSWEHMEKNRLYAPKPGRTFLSKKLDSQRGLGDYVRLSFCRDHPIQYTKIKEGASIALLIVSPEVAYFEDTLFSDMNATDKESRIGGDVDFLKSFNIQATQKKYVSHASINFKALQAEVLVKTSIRLKYILNIEDFIY